MSSVKAETAAAGTGLNLDGVSLGAPSTGPTTGNPLLNASVPLSPDGRRAEHAPADSVLAAQVSAVPLPAGWNVNAQADWYPTQLLKSDVALYVAAKALEGALKGLVELQPAEQERRQPDLVEKIDLVSTLAKEARIPARGGFGYDGELELVPLPLETLKHQLLAGTVFAQMPKYVLKADDSSGLQHQDAVAHEEALRQAGPEARNTAQHIFPVLFHLRELAIGIETIKAQQEKNFTA